MDRSPALVGLTVGQVAGRQGAGSVAQAAPGVRTGPGGAGPAPQEERGAAGGCCPSAVESAGCRWSKPGRVTGSGVEGRSAPSRPALLPPLRTFISSVRERANLGSAARGRPRPTSLGVGVGRQPQKGRHRPHRRPRLCRASSAPRTSSLDLRDGGTSLLSPCPRGRTPPSTLRPFPSPSHAPCLHSPPHLPTPGRSFHSRRQTTTPEAMAWLPRVVMTHCILGHTVSPLRRATLTFLPLEVEPCVLRPDARQ